MDTPSSRKNETQVDGQILKHLSGLTVAQKIDALQRLAIHATEERDYPVAMLITRLCARIDLRLKRAQARAERRTVYCDPSAIRARKK